MKLGRQCNYHEELVGAFNQEMALVGAFSVIVKTSCGTDGSICATSSSDNNNKNKTFVPEVDITYARTYGIELQPLDHKNNTVHFVSV